jgi:hypothetical protein
MLLCVNLCGEIVEAPRLAREGKGGGRRGERERMNVCAPVVASPVWSVDVPPP